MDGRKYSIDADMILYIVRCSVGFLIGYLLYLAFPQFELYWTMLSIILVLSPEVKDSPKLTNERVKSNLIGSCVGLFCFLLPLPEVVMMVFGITLAIVICHFFKLMNVARTAVVALIIVVIHEQETRSNWAAVERFVSVTLGCLIGLAVSTVTAFLSENIKRKQTDYNTIKVNIMSKEAYIIDGIRTPIGNLRGELSPVRTDDLAAMVIKELISRNPDIPKEAVDDVILGCHNQAGEDNRNVARMAGLLAGLPVTVPGETVNRLCSSGMSAIINAARAIKAGDGDVFIAGGVEHMTRGPLVVSKPSKAFGTDSQMFDSSFGWRFVNPKMKEMYGVDPMGITAENLAEMYKISREDQDKFSYHSQMKATKAQENGNLAEEIMPVTIPQRKGDPVIVSKDEFVRPNTTIETLAKLRPAFKTDGTVTAGNASGLNDGAAATYVVSEEALQKYNLTPLARIVSSAVVGVEPRIMGIGPVPATEKALEKAGLRLEDMEIIELNEAFAAQSLACTRALGLADDDARVNVNGGAIALGHPLGMSGTRIVLSAALSLKRQQKRYALATMCVGVGQGYAVILERV